MGNKSKRQNLQRSPSSAIMTPTVEAYSGPLPSPDMLTQYNAAFGECAERIVAMAEKQAAHRQEIEKIFITAAVKHETRAQIIGCIIALSAIIGGTIVISMDKDAVGLTAIISALAALVGVFIYGKRRQNRELAQKDRGEPATPA